MFSRWVLAIRLIVKSEICTGLKTSVQRMYFFVEVQTGTYFGEDDIERIEDDFGR
jgi:hypothetical protein